MADDSEPARLSEGVPPRAEFATHEAGFESELCDYVQARLALVTAFVGTCSGVLWIVGRVADAWKHGWSIENQLHPSPILHLAATLAAIPIYRFLRRGPLPARTLRLVDGLLLWYVIAVTASVYAFSYPWGVGQIVPLLSLLLIARAIAIPSRALRTLSLSLPAPLAVLVVQLAYGRAWILYDHPYPQEGFTAYVVWNQATLWLSIALATLSSWVVYGLRMRAYEAATFGRYTLEARLGGGSIGEVYQARHAMIRRSVAVKILRPEVAGERNLERFEMEVQRTSRLTHPNTVHVFDYGLTADGLFYYAMEHLDGSDLDRILVARGAMPAGRVLHVLMQACGALEEAHGQGLVHCDLKPANLMLCRQGGEPDVLKVLDFGLARNVRSPEALDQGAAAAGTPLTMAPEMIRGQDLSPATDLYGLGAVGYYLVTGEPPFVGETVGDVVRLHLTAAPTPPAERRPGVPDDLAACLMHALEKDPKARPESAAAFRQALSRCADARSWTREDAEAWWGAHADTVRRAVGISDVRGTSDFHTSSA